MKNPVPIWPLRARQCWFAEPDGSGYYRNCPLIMTERKAAINRGRYRLANQLQDEWQQVFRSGVRRKAALGRRDILVSSTSFREAYPDRPGLWVLDDPDK